MDHTERDVAEVDRLVRNLTSTTQSDGRGAGTGTPRPPSRWTNVTVRMPSARRAPGVGVRVSRALDVLAGRIEPVFHRAVCGLNEVRARLVRRPSAIVIVRGWVALAATCAAAMYFWPYGKTYFWGLVFYQLCLGFLLVAGIWGARLSWDARLGAAHTLAVGTVLWAITLGTVNTVTLLRGTMWNGTPTFASAGFSPHVRPVTPVSAPGRTEPHKGALRGTAAG